MMTGLNSHTFEHLQLGAGLFIKDFDPDTASTADELKSQLAQRIHSNEGLMGATRGGGTFQCKPTLRHIEADGLRTPVKGSVVNDGWTVKLTGTLLEMTPGSFADLLTMYDKTETGGVTCIRPRQQMLVEDYLPRLCWVGDTAQGALLIELTDVLNMIGTTLTFTDQGEGVMPFEFQAHQDTPVGADYAPCRILFFT
ncbi:MAG: hypothetical protein ACI4MJ_07080 [Aristaeellaceae bacterium]